MIAPLLLTAALLGPPSGPTTLECYNASDCEKGERCAWMESWYLNWDDLRNPIIEVTTRCVLLECCEKPRPCWPRFAYKVTLDCVIEGQDD